jgi:hypothetical protein
MKHFLAYTPSLWARFWASWNGRKDGKGNQPTTRPGYYENRIEHVLGAFVDHEYQKAKAREDRGCTRQRVLRNHLFEALREIGEIEKKLKADGVPPIYGGMGVAAYWSCMVLVGIGEFAFNLVAFAVFRENLLLTGLMCLAIGFSLPGSAHLVGKFAREDDAKSKDLVAGAVLGAIALSALLAINYVRTQYLSSQGQTGAASRGMALAYFAINIMIYAFACGLSYAAHEVDSRLWRLRGWEESHKKRLAAFAAEIGQRKVNLADAQGWCDQLARGASLLQGIYLRENARHWQGGPGDAKNAAHNTNPASPPSGAPPQKNDSRSVPLSTDGQVWWPVHDLMNEEQNIEAEVKEKLDGTETRAGNVAQTRVQPSPNRVA